MPENLECLLSRWPLVRPSVRQVTPRPRLRSRPIRTRAQQLAQEIKLRRRARSCPRRTSTHSIDGSKQMLSWGRYTRSDLSQWHWRDRGPWGHVMRSSRSARKLRLNFRFADFEIDVARQEVRRAGATVHVEPQVFDLVVHLIRNRDRIVSKDELFEAIWQGRIVSEATLSSRISAARRALGDSGNGQSFIRTLHRRGFRFIGDVEGDSAAPAANAIETGVALEDPVHETAKLVPAPASLSVSNEPSVAAFSFDHVSRDSDQEYLANGLAAAAATRPAVADRISEAADDFPMLHADLVAAPAAQTKAAASNEPRRTRN